MFALTPTAPCCHTSCRGALATRRRTTRVCGSRLRTSAAGGTPGEERQVGCPDLYNFCEAINEERASTGGAEPALGLGTSAAVPAANSPPDSSSNAAAELNGADAAASAPPRRGASYYAGMLTSDLAQDNGASNADMLKRSMQLAGGVSVLLVALVAAFLASNSAI